MAPLSDQIKVRIRRLPVGMSSQSGVAGEKEYSIAFLYELEPLLGITIVPAEQEQAYLAASVEHKPELEKALNQAGQNLVQDVRNLLNRWTVKVASSVVSPNPNPNQE